ncbi:MAG: glycosyltransferase [Candidatus Falkowbacteria bacterium]|nr:glycosyltransferase [Candidatus Falkowbacteria bacterium]
MRILQANKFYYPKGGADKYFLDLTKALNAAGHETAVFAMADPRNLESPYSRYFASPVEFNGGGLKDKLKIPGRMIYSREAKRKFARELDDFKPDIVHVHNIYHQLSPSILEAAKARGIPVVMHLHDYKLICPNYRLFTKGHICRKCLDEKSYLPCLTNNCYKSYLQSSLATLEMTIHHKWLHIYEKNLDLLIAPSEFMRRLVIESGWPAEKIITIYNPAPKISEALLNTEDDLLKNDYQNDYPEEDYLLYFGRLAPEKGISDLAQAVKSGGGRSGQKLHIVGAGPEEKNIRTEFGPEIKSGQIKLLGRLTGQSLNDEITKARAVVFPSIWPENMPLALLESLAQGKIVIASRVGGLPEIIKDKENGFLFKAGDIKELEAVIKAVCELKPEIKKNIELRARESARILDPGSHLAKILQIYSKLAKKSG